MITRVARFANAKAYGLPAFSQLLVVLILTLPAVQWLVTSQSIWVVPLEHLPRGQLAYLLSKLAALYAVAVFALQLAYGIAGVSARASLGQDRGLRFHRALGIATLCLLVTHAVLFISAASMRVGHFATHFALPGLFGDFYTSRIALGWWAGVALITAAVCALLRAQLVRWWRFVHWLSLPAGPAVVVHSLSIGTESRMPIMLAAYACMAALLAIAVIVRLSIAASAASPSE